VIGKEIIEHIEEGIEVKPIDIITENGLDMNKHVD